VTRFFIEGQHRRGDVVAFARDDVHRIVDVLRKRDGDRVVVVDSASREFVASLAIDGDRVQGRLDEETPSRAVESPRTITLAQAIPKGQKFDFVVEKATELGVARIVPLETSRSIAEASAHKLERWRKLARSAAQQSGRTTIPEIVEPIAFGSLLTFVHEFDAALFAWELATNSLRATLAEIADRRNVLVIVGPEGGFSHAEADAAVAAGTRPVSLGPRILRTETAPLVILAAMLYDSDEL
jgi:16S rRNA (uracil1498-N3)-methyltransferase